MRSTSAKAGLVMGVGAPDRSGDKSRWQPLVGGKKLVAEDNHLESLDCFNSKKTEQTVLERSDVAGFVANPQPLTRTRQPPIIP